MKRLVMDESDLLLVSALQDAPRARWADLARILSMSEDTVSERWHRLVSNGMAWVSLVDHQDVNARFMSYVLIQTNNGRRSAILERLIPHPLVQTIHSVSGEHNMLLLLETDGLRETEWFLQGTLETISGIARFQVLPVVTVVTSGTHWRTAALTKNQRDQLSKLDIRPDHPTADATWVLRDAVAVALMEELAIDGRMTTAELARVLNQKHGLDTSPSTVGRKLTRLLSTPRLRIRCDVSATDLGWHAVVVLWGRINSAEAAKFSADPSGTSATFRRLLPELRSLVVVAGASNLHATAWLHSLDALPQLEEHISALLPSLEIRDRSVIFSTPKRMGSPLVHGRRSVGD